MDKYEAPIDFFDLCWLAIIVGKAEIEAHRWQALSDRVTYGALLRALAESLLSSPHD